MANLGETSVGDLMKENPYLATPEQAQSGLESMKEILQDLQNIPSDLVLDAEDRQRLERSKKFLVETNIPVLEA